MQQSRTLPPLPHARRLGTVAVALIAGTALTGCETIRQLDTVMPSRQQRAQDLVNRSRSPAPAKDPILQDDDGALIITTTRKAPRGPVLPPSTNTAPCTDISFPRPTPITQVASALTSVCGIPIQVAIANVKGQPAAPAAAATIPAASTPGSLPTMANLGYQLPAPQQSNAAMMVQIPQRGISLRRNLDAITLPHNLAWRFDGQKITVTNLITKTWTLPTGDLRQKVTASVAGLANTSAGNSGSGSSSSSSSGDSGSSQQLSVTNTNDYYAQLEADLTKIITGIGGDFTLNRTTGNVFARVPPSAEADLDAFMRREIATALRSVTFDVMLVSWDSKAADDYGLDITTLFHDAGLTIAASGPINTRLPTNAASLGYSLVSPPVPGASSFNRHFAGSSAALAALAEKGAISISLGQRTTIANNTSGKLSDRLRQDYLASTTGSPTTTTGIVGGTTATPATIYSGVDITTSVRILDDGTVSAFVNVGRAEEPQLTRETSGTGANQAQITVPRQRELGHQQFASLRSGEMLVLTGFSVDNEERRDQGTLTATFWGLGGSKAANDTKRRYAFVLIATEVNTRQPSDQPQTTIAQ